MISLGGAFLMSSKKADKSDRKQQIQFRMNPEKLKALKSAIAYDDNMHSMADLFNKAADDYLKKHKKGVDING